MLALQALVEEVPVTEPPPFIYTIPSNVSRSIEIACGWRGLCVDTNGRITVFGDEVVGVVRIGKRRGMETACVDSFSVGMMKQKRPPCGSSVCGEHGGRVLIGLSPEGESYCGGRAAAYHQQIAPGPARPEKRITAGRFRRWRRRRCYRQSRLLRSARSGP